MGLLLPSQKHKLDGIGSVTATSVMALLEAYPPTKFLTVGVLGKITYAILKRLFSFMASGGLVSLNLGAEKILGAIEKHDFDGSWESAQKIIDAIRSTGRDLTPEEIVTIDNGVIEAFRKFGKITRKRG